MKKVTQPKTKICKHCSAQQPYENNYCTECGTRIANLRYCPKCGGDNEIGGVICPHCDYIWPEMQLLNGAPRAKTEPAGANVGKTAVQSAFAQMGISSKREQDQILSELKAGTKVADEAAIRGSVEINTGAIGK